MLPVGRRFRNHAPSRTCETSSRARSMELRARSRHVWATCSRRALWLIFGTVIRDAPFGCTPLHSIDDEIVITCGHALRSIVEFRPKTARHAGCSFLETMPNAKPCPRCAKTGLVRVEYIITGKAASRLFYCGGCEYQWSIADQPPIADVPPSPFPKPRTRQYGPKRRG